MDFSDFAIVKTSSILNYCGINADIRDCRLLYFGINQAQRGFNKVSKIGRTAAKVYELITPKSLAQPAAPSAVAWRMDLAFQLSGLASLPSTLFFLGHHLFASCCYASSNVWEPAVDNICESFYTLGQLTQTARVAIIVLQNLSLLKSLAATPLLALGGAAALLSLATAVRHGINTAQLGIALYQGRNFSVVDGGEAQRWCIRKYLWVDSNKVPDLSFEDQRKRFAVIAGYHSLSALSHLVNVVGLGCLLTSAILCGHILVLSAAVIGLLAIAYQTYWRLQFAQEERLSV